jgi:hypothetical protein
MVVLQCVALLKFLDKRSLSRHSGESRNPVPSLPFWRQKEQRRWIPAFAGMTSTKKLSKE